MADTLVSLDGEVVAVSMAAPAVGGATAANQATMIVSLQLIDDLRNALDSVGTDELDVNVEASVLPTGASTEVTLAAVQTAVEILDNIVAGSEAQVDVVTMPNVAQTTHDNLNANVNIQVGDADVAAGNPVPMVDTWEIVLISDEAADDSDKTLTVPAGYEYQILWIWVEFASDGNAGDRQLQIDLRDGADDVIGQFRTGIVQAASLTRYYMFGPALADLIAFRDTDYLMTPLPPTVFLPAGYDLRIFDNNAVAVATDDMVIQMQVARRAV